MNEDKKEMTKEEFERWCNNYGIFHYLNVEMEEWCAFHVIASPFSSIDKPFLEESLADMVYNYSNVEIVYNNQDRPNEHLVIINF